jgi:hypothetical protein
MPVEREDRLGDDGTGEQVPEAERNDGHERDQCVPEGVSHDHVSLDEPFARAVRT